MDKYRYTFISKERFQQIFNTYKKVDCDDFPSSDDWHAIVEEGSDPKFGRWYISDKLKLIRRLTMDEFYMGGPVYDQKIWSK